jgi:hypothetical protein
MRLAFPLAIFAVSASAFATPVVIAPDEAASKDTFIYSAIPSFNFGTRDYLGASVESSGVHTTTSLIQFDVAGQSVAANEAATLSIYVRTSAGTPFAAVSSEPSAAAPVTVDIYRITSAWNETTTTWATRPTTEASPVASFVASGVEQYYSADLTALVQSWIADPASNFGIELRQRSVVTVPGAPDAAPFFQSSNAPNKPTLTIAVVPEPLTLASLAFVPMLAARRRR